ASPDDQLCINSALRPGVPLRDRSHRRGMDRAAVGYHVDVDEPTVAATPHTAPGLHERLDMGAAPGAGAPVGTRARTGEVLPAAGVWALEEHATSAGPCPWSGHQTALAAGREAPTCPDGHAAGWRLEHVAPSAAVTA